MAGVSKNPAWFGHTVFPTHILPLKLILFIDFFFAFYWTVTEVRKHQKRGEMQQRSTMVTLCLKLTVSVITGAVEYIWKTTHNFLTYDFGGLCQTEDWTLEQSWFVIFFQSLHDYLFSYRQLSEPICFAFVKHLGWCLWRCNNYRSFKMYFLFMYTCNAKNKTSRFKSQTKYFW